MKTLSTLDPHVWHKLAQLYKVKAEFESYEIALLGARYCDFSSRELMQEWLGVFHLNRWHQMTPKEILRQANSCDEGMCLVVNIASRQLEELQVLLFTLDKPKART